MEEIRILLNESTFTKLCKVGYLQQGTPIGRVDVYITKADLKVIASSKILEKEVAGFLFKIALQDIGIELIREIVRRSPVYSEIAGDINIDKK